MYKKLIIAVGMYHCASGKSLLRTFVHDNPPPEYKFLRGTITLVLFLPDLKVGATIISLLRSCSFCTSGGLCTSRSCCIYRQRKIKSCAFAFFCFKPDCATIFFHKFFGKQQAKSRSLLLFCSLGSYAGNGK